MMRSWLRGEESGARIFEKGFAEIGELKGSTETDWDASSHLNAGFWAPRPSGFA